MVNSSQQNPGNFTGLLPDAAAGIATGLVVDVLALEGWVHQSMAHRNTACDPTLAGVSRAAMIATGMSPNRGALNHRVHHAETEVDPKNYLDSVKEAFDFTGGDDAQLDTGDNILLFPGYTFDDDPLLRQRQDGSLMFRSDPAIERLAAKSIVHRALPLIATTAAIGLFNKYLGREKPFSKAISFMSGTIIGLSAGIGATSYGEARSGKVDGQMPIRGLLKVNLARHQEHHDDPANLFAGSRRRDRLAFRILERAGLATKTPPKSAG